jgi:hypothetical protein
MADTMNIIAAHRLTGGTQWSLDWFPIASLIDQDKAVVTDGTNIYFFEFDATSVLAEDVVTHPYKIRPDDYSTQGVWVEQVPYSTGGGSGTVTSVSVVSANGISGSVANPTTTPAITLSLGAITPTTVNGLTLTAQAVGFTIAGGTTSKTLTVAADASVSGTNTGDSAYWTIAATVMSPTTAGNTVSIPLNDIKTTYTTGLLLTNPTASDGTNTIQYPPSLNFYGSAYDTPAGPSVSVEWSMGVRPLAGATVSSVWYLRHSLGGGSFSDVLTLTSAGVMGIGSNFSCNNVFIANGAYVGNATNTDRGYFKVGTTGAGNIIYRNISDAYATVSINNVHASSTGNICDFQAQSVTLAYVDVSGIMKAAGYKSSDGTAGESATITIAGLTNITVKNGLVVAHS